MDMQIDSPLSVVDKIFYEYANSISDLTETFTAGYQYWRYGYKDKNVNAYSRPLSDEIFETSDHGKLGSWPELRNGKKATLEKSGRLRSAQKLESSDSVREIGKDYLKLGIKGIPYSNLQHFGYKQTPTTKQIGFFWWRYRVEKDDKWKRMAIIGIKGKQLIYKARPYFVTKDNRMPPKFINFFVDYMKGRVMNLEDQLKLINNNVKLPPGVL